VWATSHWSKGLSCRIALWCGSGVPDETRRGEL